MIRTMYKCCIDGNALCIIGKDFINLAESRAVFIELTEKQIKDIKDLKADKGSC